MPPILPTPAPTGDDTDIGALHLMEEGTLLGEVTAGALDRKRRGESAELGLRATGLYPARRAAAWGYARMLLGRDAPDDDEKTKSSSAGRSEGSIV